MTAPLPFGALLRSMLTRRGMRQVDLARRTGYSTSGIRRWLIGSMLPRPETAARLAEALDAPGLLLMCQRLRTKACALSGCGREFIDGHRSNKRIYCWSRCQGVANNRRLRRVNDVRNGLATKRLALYVAAVDGFCRRCEPEGWCRMPDCELRAVSPLPVSLGKAM